MPEQEYEVTEGTPEVQPEVQATPEPEIPTDVAVPAEAPVDTDAPIEPDAPSGMSTTGTSLNALTGALTKDYALVIN